MRRVLIANRGEIAVRIARACHSRGLEVVAVHSDADRDAPHVLAADLAVHLGPSPARESYLVVDKILAAAGETGADAIHPGYGFFSENATFARAVEDAGLTWIGPTPDVIATMGDKVEARAAVVAAGVPVVPGADVDPRDPRDAVRAAERLGFPVLVKAAAGGGGKGMRAVADAAGLGDALAAAGREAAAAFGDGRVYLEKLLRRPRHVEVQVLGDAHGNLIHLGERECSIQRRHQKIIEEAPCPALSPALRAAITQTALAAARAVGYRSTGTVELLLDEDGRFYFLEMNTRLQVEHPVTELITGVDLVGAQLDVASGKPLAFRQEDIELRGHAIEARLYAEDAAAGFAPSAGPILALREPQGPGVRVDSGVAAGYVVPLDYDPMLAKVSAWGPDRATAIARLAQALRETIVVGPTTNTGFLGAVLGDTAFARGDTHTGFLAERLPDWKPSEDGLDVAALAAALVVRAAPGRVAAAGDALTLPTPWQTLGGWRLGR
jgi:acetyl-CoA carboxylase biotin carboxylase subunit